LHIISSEVLIVGPTALLYGRQYHLFLFLLRMQYILLISPGLSLGSLLLQLIKQVIDLLSLVILLDIHLPVRFFRSLSLFR
jgi:hypothetical protein